MAQTPLIPIGGSLGWAVGNELTVAVFGTPQVVTELFPRVISAPSSAPLTVELRAISGTLSASIPVGELAPTSPATGSLDVDAGEALRQVITADGGARDFSGYMERQSAGVTPSTVGFTTVALVKRDRGITDAANDAMINDMILSVTKRMQQYMDRDIFELTYTGERFDGGAYWVTTRQYPIVSIGTVTSFGEAIDPSGLRISSNGTEIERVANGVVTPFACGHQSIEADYTAGYAAIPYDLTHACTTQVAYEFMRTQPSGRDALGIEQSTNASGGTTAHRTDEWAEGVQGILDRYRKII